MDNCISAALSDIPKKGRPEIKTQIGEGSIWIDIFLYGIPGAMVFEYAVKPVTDRIRDYIKTKMKIGNRKPVVVQTEGNTSKVKMDNDEIVEVDSTALKHLIEFPKLNNSLAIMNKQLSVDNTREGYKVIKHDGEIVSEDEYTKNEVSAVINPIDFSKTYTLNTEKLMNVRAKVDRNYLEGNGNWGLILLHNNQKISTVMADLDFVTEWKKKSATSGATLMIDLESTAKSNLNGKVIGKSTYTVTRATLLVDAIPQNYSMFDDIG